jgi:hypothetical protein
MEAEIQKILYSDSEYIVYRNWLMQVNKDDNEVTVIHAGFLERRVYDIPNPIKKVVHEEEYVYIYTDINIYQFKFETGCFLVGDVLDFDFEFLEEFAMYVFGEDS